jgi:hypothetical protein
LIRLARSMRAELSRGIFLYTTDCTLVSFPY